MTLPITLGLMIAFLAAAALCGWMGQRPRQLGKPSMVPWPVLMMILAALGLLMAVHLANLFGLQTGNRQQR